MAADEVERLHCRRGGVGVGDAPVLELEAEAAVVALLGEEEVDRCGRGVGAGALEADDPEGLAQGVGVVAPLGLVDELAGVGLERALLRDEVDPTDGAGVQAPGAGEGQQLAGGGGVDLRTGAGVGAGVGDDVVGGCGGDVTRGAGGRHAQDRVDGQPEVVIGLPTGIDDEAVAAVLDLGGEVGDGVAGGGGRGCRGQGEAGGADRGGEGERGERAHLGDLSGRGPGGRDPGAVCVWGSTRGPRRVWRSLAIHGCSGSPTNGSRLRVSAGVAPASPNRVATASRQCWPHATAGLHLVPQAFEPSSAASLRKNGTGPRGGPH